MDSFFLLRSNSSPPNISQTNQTQAGSNGSMQNNMPLAIDPTVAPGGRRFVCTEPGCTARFKTGTHLRRHRTTVHSNDRPYSCNFPGCTSRFTRRDNLNQHIRNCKWNTARTNSLAAVARAQAQAIASVESLAGDQKNGRIFEKSPQRKPFSSPKMTSFYHEETQQLHQGVLQDGSFTEHSFQEPLQENSLQGHLQNPLHDGGLTETHSFQEPLQESLSEQLAETLPEPLTESMRSYSYDQFPSGPFQTPFQPPFTHESLYYTSGFHPSIISPSMIMQTASLGARPKPSMAAAVATKEALRYHALRRPDDPYADSDYYQPLLPVGPCASSPSALANPAQSPTPAQNQPSWQQQSSLVQPVPSPALLSASTPTFAFMNAQEFFMHQPQSTSPPMGAAALLPSSVPADQDSHADQPPSSSGGLQMSHTASTSSNSSSSFHDIPDVASILRSVTPSPMSMHNLTSMSASNSMTPQTPGNGHAAVGTTTSVIDMSIAVAAAAAVANTSSGSANVKMELLGSVGTMTPLLMGAAASAPVTTYQMTPPATYHDNDY